MHVTNRPAFAAMVLCTFLLSAGALWAAPKITAATADPDSIAPGETTRVTCRLEDPDGLVQRIVCTVREAPDYILPLRKGADGAWTFTLPVPGNVEPGTYHLDVELAGADGKPIRAEAGSRTLITVTVTGPAETPVAAPRAADPKPELATTEVATESGAKILLKSPYRNHANWYKGQMHCHTTNSDGKCTPAQLEAKYRQAGNDFLIITDHDKITPDPAAEEGRDVPVFITGEEDEPVEGHMVVVAAGAHIAAKSGQDIIDRAESQGGLVMLNHPEWAGGIYDLRELDRLVGYNFIEMCNGGFNHQRPWDYVLSQGKYVWGVASDDFHGGPGDEVAKYYIVVNAPEPTAEAILANLRSGNFYASEGPKLEMYIDGDWLVVISNEGSTVSFRGRYGIPYQKSQTVQGAKGWATYRFQGDEGYMRVEVERHSDGKHAWSQPIFVERK